MFHFCTYFDRNYLTRGLALYDSLKKHCSDPFVFWVLCFDQETFEILETLALPEMRLISEQLFLDGDVELQRAKQDRTRTEFFWTCTPSLPLFLLCHHPEIDLITYLDADLYFFSDLAPIFQELGSGSILLSEHRFPPALERLKAFGIYNVGLLAFRRDENGLNALQWWRERCIEWCYNRLEDGRMGDQKYLDDWTTRFQNVVVLTHPGCGLAPWNVLRYSLKFQDNQIYAGGQPLVFYHFHRFHEVRSWVYAPGIDIYLELVGGAAVDSAVLMRIYAHYCKRLQEMSQRVAEITKTPDTARKQISVWEILRGISRAKYFLVKPLVLARLLADWGLWRSAGEYWARQGIQLFEQGEYDQARRSLFKAAIRSPGMLSNAYFWRALAQG